MLKGNIYIIVAILFISLTPILNAETLDTIPKSLEKRMEIKKYKSFSFGMEINFSDNSSLKNFIEYELPDYVNIYNDNKLKSFTSGLGFFGGAEMQIAKHFSAKLDYKYFLKSYNSSENIYSNYDFSYNNHEIYLKGYYLVPIDYIIFKIGGGAGFLHSTFNYKYYATETSYTSNGLGITLEGIMNAQLSKNVAGYLEGYISNTFQSKLKSGNGIELKARNGDTVNLNSFSIGLRVGVEIFIF